MKEIKVVLSIGIIFKNEIRCLERCVKSLQQVRDAVSCQLVMADTGSDDGSRAVAEKYADVFFDFPWIKDFAAARNAVLDRCTGVWFMWLDADEWLDEDVSELIRFMKSPRLWRQCVQARLTIRNYAKENDFHEYSDFRVVRIFRTDQGVRFEGAIHEHMSISPGTGFQMEKTILHHDGYVDFGSLKGEAKRQRNMELLKKELEKNPESLRTLMQCIDSSVGEECDEYIRRAIEGVQQKLPNWERYGPPIYRNAVTDILGKGPAEIGRAAEQARAMFPNSVFTKIDVAYFYFFALYQEKKYIQATQVGEEYLQTMEEFVPETCIEIVNSPLMAGSPTSEHQVRSVMADAYFQIEQYQKAVDMLDTVVCENLQTAEIGGALKVMLNLHNCYTDMGRSMYHFWKDIKTRKNTDMDVFHTTAVRCFVPERREAEDEKGWRHSYTAYLPLDGKDEVGTAAAIMETDDPQVLTLKLMSVKRWDEMPIHAVAHALEHGAQYPLPGRDAVMEDMDVLAGRLKLVKGSAVRLALRTDPKDLSDWDSLCWTRALCLTAVRVFPWMPGEDSEDQEERQAQGEALFQLFAQMEGAFLPRYYAPEMLAEGMLRCLPSMHRLGWYFSQALDARERGALAEYVSLLGKGLDVCPEGKQMVEFLLERVEEERRESAAASAPPELLELAGQVRAVLEQYAPDDPAVRALKESPAYQQVAWLIEPAAGRLAQ